MSEISMTDPPRGSPLPDRVPSSLAVRGREAPMSGAANRRRWWQVSPIINESDDTILTH